MKRYLWIVLPLILFYFLEFGHTQFNPVCKGKRYMCDYEAEIHDPNICMYVNDTKNKLHLIQNCPTTALPYCNFTNISWGNPVYCSAAPATNKTFPGEYCSANSQCHSGQCSGSVCQGAAVGSQCKDDRDCAVGTFCSSTLGTCQTQQDFGSNCTRDNECVNNCACNLGTCVYYYSFDSFLDANNPLACDSGYIESGQCYPALTSVYKGRPCTSDDDCMVTTYKGDKKQYGECQCGYNGGGFTYCTLAEGDDEFTSMKAAFKFVVARGFNCHTLLRFGPCSQIYDDEYTEYQIAARYFNQYPQLVFNDACVKKEITQDFWQFMAADRLKVLSLSTLLCLFLFVFLLI